MLENTYGLGRSTNIYLFIIFVWPPSSQKCDSEVYNIKTKIKTEANLK